MKGKVVCVHIGARAHYLLPKALESKNKLAFLITDTWISSAFVRSMLAKIPVRIVRSFSNRFSPHISSKHVRSFSFKFLIIEIYLRIKKLSGWSLISKRNQYFQKFATAILRQTSSDDAVLGISYTSLELFKLAKQRGQKTILFQIDPGYKEEQIVSDIVNEFGDVFTTNWKPAPKEYWEKWKEECLLSDVIMVNSDWSRQCLVEEGIYEGKIRLLPLPFQIESKHLNFVKNYPEKFTKRRPLRCLFLGTLTLRKGIHIVLETASRLIDYPVEFILVGQNELDASLLQGANISYKGVATRADTDLYYQNSDIFLFPTLSDGFGLTQLEAMSWQLPVIASKCAGEVVVNNFNGILLNTCDTDELVKSICSVLEDVSFLQKLSKAGIETLKKFTVEEFADGLVNLI